MARNTRKTVALAFVGSAEIRPLTIRALLNDRFGFGDPDENGVFADSTTHQIVAAFFPAGPAHWNENLEKVWNWTAEADIEYDLVLDKHGKDDDLEHVAGDATNVIEVTNVSKALVDNLAKVEADEKYLIVLWGDEDAEPDEEAEAALSFAEVAGIQALDLTMGLEVLQFGDQDEEDEPAPAPEPEPEPEERPRRGRRSKPEPEPEEESLDEDEEILEEEEPKPVVDEARYAPEKARKPKDVTPAEEPESWGEAGAGHVAQQEIPEVIGRALRYAHAFHALTDETNMIKNLGDELRPSPLTALLQEALGALEGLVGAPAPAVAESAPEEPAAAPEEPEEPRRRGRPRTRTEETVGYLLNEQEGTYRKAGRGRPRRGETRVELTQAQIDDLTKQELIDED